MSDGLFFFLGSITSVIVLMFVLVLVAWRRSVKERQFSEALMLVETSKEQAVTRDLLSLTSAMSYGLLLRQAILERCEGIEDDDERMSFVDDMVEIAEAYGDGLVKRSKSSHY